MKKTSKNIKVLALILLTSALLLTTASTASVKAQTGPTVYVYTSQGGEINANGTKLTGSTIYNYTNGETISYTATPGSGYAFLCWVWSGATLTSSTEPTLTETLSSSSCALQALFVPTTNSTAAPSGSGAAEVVALMSLGGTTSPAAGQSYTNYTVGTVSNFVATPSTDCKFLYWLVVSSAGSTYYTSSTLALNIPASTIALQAFFVPTSSSVTINEYSNVAVVVLAIVLAVSALGAFTFTKRAKH